MRSAKEQESNGGAFSLPLHLAREVCGLQVNWKTVGGRNCAGCSRLLWLMSHLLFGPHWRQGCPC